MSHMRWFQHSVVFHKLLRSNAELRKSYTWKQLIASGGVAGFSFFIVTAVALSFSNTWISAILFPFALLMIYTASSDLFVIDAALLSIPLMRKEISILSYLKVISGSLIGNLTWIMMLSGFSYRFIPHTLLQEKMNNWYSFEVFSFESILYLILPGLLIGLAMLSWRLYVNPFIRLLTLCFFMIFYNWLTLEDTIVNFYVMCNVTLESHSLSALSNNILILLYAIIGNVIGAFLSSLPFLRVKKIDL